MVQKSNKGRADIAHILAASEYIHPDCKSGINYEISNAHFISDHYFIFASFYLHFPNITPSPPTTIQFQYRRVAQIPLRQMYPKDTNDPTPPWFAPKAICVLPDEVRSYVKMHDALAMAHDHPKAQSNLHHITQHLAVLVSLTTALYHTHIVTTLRPTVYVPIPRTPHARRIISQACAHWKKASNNS